FVPMVFATSNGPTALEHGGRAWELMEWLPGQADYRDRPSTRRLEAACCALAQVHDAWAATTRKSGDPGPIPAVRRRMEAAGQQGRVIAPPPNLLPTRGHLLAEKLNHHLPRIPSLLSPWLQHTGHWPVCLRDVWHDHLLFAGEQVVGLVDYAGIGPDSVAADL